jgi:hypothetical protein
VTSPFDPDRADREARWLVKHTEFYERPATIMEFIGPGYLDIDQMVRPGLKKALLEIFGEHVNSNNIALVIRAMVTGAIGIGKTTIASIILPYMCHWVLCLKDPQKFFDLLPGSRIAFMMMSTSEDQAREVIFQDVKARIEHSDWFVNNYPYDPKYTKSIRFPKDIWILPGDSSETTFEGYNILGGILDEADSHKVTKDKDYAQTGYDTINARIESRYDDRGLIVVIGQMKKAEGFAARTFEKFLKDPKAHTTRMTIWESRGWSYPRYLKPDGTRDSFFYDSRRREIIPDELGKDLVASGVEHVFEVPTVYKQSFINDPIKALRDLAGVPPAIGDPFIGSVDRIESCRTRWIERHGLESPVTASVTSPQLADWFRANLDPRKRAVHIDLATSPDGDALGMAMGHVEGIVEVDGEDKPYIVIDMLYRVKARPGYEIQLSDVRRLLYELRDDRGFKIRWVTYDGFQSTDSVQQLRKKRFLADNLSVDRTTLPYEDLRDAIIDQRLEFPPYVTFRNVGDDKEEEVAVRELMQLEDTGKKIDHPTKGSKDLADAMAGVVTKLMGDRSFHRGLRSTRRPRELGDADEKNFSQGSGDDAPSTGFEIPGLPFYSGLGSGRGMGVQSPLPPSGLVPGSLALPARLMPREKR